MLRLAAVIIAWCMASAAFAQTDIDGLGNYRLGMSRAEAEAANPGRWGEIVMHPINVPASQGTPTGETGGPGILFAGSRYSTRLVFRGDQLRMMSFEHARQGAERNCPRLFAYLMTKLEEEWGPLTGEATPWETDALSEGRTRTTNGGSRYRVYERDGRRAWGARANSGEDYRIQVSAMHIPPGERGICILTITIRDDYGLGPDFTPEEPPTLEQLTAAPVAENTQSVTLPGFENVHMLMPKFAQDEGVYGRAEMECLVREDRSYWCRVTNETPPGIGFGLSALAAQQYVRAAPEAEGGAPTGSRVIRRLTFADPQDAE